MKIIEFIKLEKIYLEQFKKWWMEKNSKNSINFPLELDNIEEWSDQFFHWYTNVKSR